MAEEDFDGQSYDEEGRMMSYRVVEYEDGTFGIQERELLGAFPYWTCINFTERFRTQKKAKDTTRPLLRKHEKHRRSVTVKRVIEEHEE